MVSCWREIQKHQKDMEFSSQKTALDLSRRCLSEFPVELLSCSSLSNLESLYLEGNQLTTLPDSLFSSCPNLKWLDLRNNQLKVLPPAIEKLRFLKTLLLEGNQLVSLPVQLCRLPHLTGLNICRNPLTNPPKHVTEKGAKAVISYLREMMNDEGISSSDSSSSLADSGDGSSTYIPLKPMTTSQDDGPYRTLPMPELKPATLHTQEFQRNTYSPSHTHGKSRSTRSLRGRGPGTQAPERKQFSQIEINKSLDKMKSKRGLEEWRNQARLQQIEASQREPVVIPSSVPYATQVKAKPELIQDHPPMQYKLGEGLRYQKVEKYKAQLEEKRKQVGLITEPSSELQHAEKCLAEAMAMQEELEARKAKEYRFTAFTGDLPY